MTEIYAINAARTLDRPIVHREDNAVSLAQRHYLYTRLHARPLLGHHKLASMEVSPRFREKNCQLQREDVLSIEILMKTVVISRSILQQQRSRFALPSLVAAFDELRVLRGKAHVDSHCFVPAVRDVYQMRIDRRSQLGDQLRQRILEIFVLAPPKAMA